MMSKFEWPEELVERFRSRRVSLFIGAGCGRSAGLPDWRKLLESIRDRFRDHKIVDDTDLQRLKGWWQKPHEFPKIAKFFCDRDKEFYRRAMQSIFDPVQTLPDRKPPRYFHYFPALSISTIVTTNFDSLLEDALSPHRYTSLTWHDPEEFSRFLRDPRPFIFHLHGIASRFGTVVHTLDEYRALEGPSGLQALEFLSRILERETLVFIGYGLADREISFVASKYYQLWNRWPHWFLLAANPSAETVNEAREKFGLTIVPYAPDVANNDSHGAAIDAMFVDLAGHLGIADVRIPSTDATGPSEKTIVAITPDFLRAQVPITDETRRQFYRGHEPTWPLVRDNATAERDIVADVIRKIDGGSRCVLLTGAGGEGKSTVLRQIAIVLAERGDRVYFARADNSLDLRDLLKQERGSISILIDDAEDLSNAEDLLTFAERRRESTHLVLGARANEWRERHRSHATLQRRVEPLVLTRLSEREANEIARLIYDSGATCTEADKKTLATRLRVDTNGFLLAAMLVATEGRQLLEILRDVVETISNWPDGEILIRALATVVAHESRKTPQGRRIFCSQRLFREVMGGFSSHQMHQLCNRLTGEVSLSPRGGYRVESRHPIIADAVARILFDPPTCLVNEMEVYEWIIRAAGRFSRDEVNPSERKLLSSLPLDFKRLGRTEDARQLFQAAIEADAHVAHTWQAWALMEKEANNVGAIDAPGTARFLFNKGTEADPHDAHTWQAWALMEKEANNVGAIDAPGTARFLFNKGTEADPHDAHTWQAWALMEKKANNVDAIDAPGTARFLFNKGTEADPHDAHTWQAWALMEKEAKNVGAIDAPGTARFLFNKGTEADPHDAPTWQAWALMEHELGEVTEANRLCQIGLVKCPGAAELVWLEQRMDSSQPTIATAKIERLIAVGDILGAKSELALALARNPIDSNLLSLASQLSKIIASG